MKKIITLKPEFKLTKEELTQYNELPENMPDTKLTKKQVEFINGLYYKYITKHIDNRAWNAPMFEVEKREKWPSGPRVKAHEAKRFILNNLVHLNSEPELTPLEAALKFHAVIECRPMYSKLVKLVYDMDKAYELNRGKK
jgi:hypothetical protein